MAPATLIKGTLLPVGTALVGLLTLACSKREPAQNTRATPPPPPPREIDPCTLFTAEEIQATQRAALQEAKASYRDMGGMRYSQCYITLPTLPDSIVLVVMQRGSGEGARDPRQVWQETFHGERQRETEREREEGEPERLPEKLDGLGDEAYWSWQGRGGTLHVLKGGSMVRISIGGPGDEADKRQKLRALAEKILARL